MSGICGEARFDGGPASAAGIEKMAEMLAPRGPDGFGLVLHQGIGFAQRLLATIGLDAAAAQPFTDNGLGLTIAMDGAILNHRELRRELDGLGHEVASAGDAEVVLKAWAEWGPNAVRRFAGMFAFALHERDSGRLVLVRDRFGMKPLYLAEMGKALSFASTLPALLSVDGIDRSIDPIALHHYMSWHAVVPAPRTILNGVRKLPPATIRIYDADGSHRDDVYWRPDFTRSPEEAARGMEGWADLVLDSLRAAVRRCEVADVPVGVLLSGGVDSSLIVGLLAEAGHRDIPTFSIGFEEAHGERGDEFLYSDLIAKHYGTRHSKIFIPSERMRANLPSAIRAMSEPMVSYDAIGFYLLSAEVTKSINSVQSGQGADELFGGYHWYPMLTGSTDPVADYAAAFFDRTHAQMAGHVAADYLPDRDESLEFLRAHFAAEGADDPVDKALRLDTNIMLVDDPAKRVDNMTMAWGLEARMPFLDNDLVDLANRIPAELKLADGGKGVLKAAARKIIPAEVIDRPKGYFPVPALKYIDGPYLEMVRDALTSQPARERGLFRKDYLDRLFADPASHITKLRGSELWQVALLELWLQEHGI